MFLGYNTNGFAHHRLKDVAAILAELGYQGIAITPDVHHLNPFERATLGGWTVYDQWLLHTHQLRCVIESGARYILDPRRKHQPTLIDPTEQGRSRRRNFIIFSIDLAARLRADCVSLWSGTPSDEASSAELMSRLVDECSVLCRVAEAKHVRLAFEPEPGMFVDTMDKFAELHEKVNHPAFGLTVDVGHLVCQGELPVSEHLIRWKDWLWNVHIEDMRRGAHDHLMFGDGEVDFADVFAGLRAAGYGGMVSVELSRHSHDAVNTARRSMAFLRQFV
jgi:sugar phosphate isomerase/epimerase